MPAHTTSAVVSRRTSEPEDEALLRALFAESRPDLDLLPVPTREAVLDMQFRAQHAQYTSCYPHARHEIVEVDGVAVGRMIIDDASDAVRIVDVTIAAAYRNHGVGSSVLEAVLAEAGARPVRLSVWAANTGAQRLYARLGFVVYGDATQSTGYLRMQHAENRQEGS